MSKKSYSRIFRAPRSSFFLLGARGTGKSTWARETFADALSINLLDEGLYQRLLADPGLFADMLRAVEADRWVVVDEVQRIPGLLNEVHRFIEEAGLRFALLGSSARKLRTAGTNLLAGRALWKTLFPLVPEELGEDFDLESVLLLGSIPLIWSAPDRQETLKAYVQLYLREEIKAEALVRNLPGFVRFLPIAGLFHGQSLNISAIARDCGVARTTAAGYLDILEDTLLAWRLPGYEARLRVQERKHPKLYWLDPGLVRAVKRQIGPTTAEERGPLLEGWIHTLLRAYQDQHELWHELSYWAPGKNASLEVDFLLERGGEYLAIEVKAASTFSRSSLKGMKAIQELPGLVRRIIIYTGREDLRVAEGVEVWTIRRFLDALERNQLWP